MRYFLLTILVLTISTVSLAQCQSPMQSPLPDIATLDVKSRLGDVQAQYSLGTAYLFGQGIEQNQTLGVRLLTQAADKGYADADQALAVAYSLGCGVAKDDNESWRRWVKAAEEGSGSSQWMVGGRYERDGNCTEAAKWYLKAALQGRPEAQVSLGSLYEEGCGVTRDYKQAAEWYRKATENPSWDGEGRNELGMLYADGKGVPKDLIEAYKWFALAGVKDNLESVACDMTPEQIAEAQRRAKQWAMERTKLNTTATAGHRGESDK